ncbi:Protein RTF2 [Vanrija pseudolonga]|uniref:Protein RTF2 n=1 Tax=Vanrija pseudolonga TaxID=143232 RepID=A0AAF0YAA6_9TREE|nr:Protein RTF2 [Vanrija pseudolonga]
MGADGGSIPDRRDLVKTKGKAEQADKAAQRERFLFCALSKKPLAKPVVADPLGKLYNKDAIIEFLIDKAVYGDGDSICPYIKGVKDLLTLNLMPNPAAETDDASTSTRAPFVCWLSLKEMTGAIPFIALKSCGCVFSDAAVRAIIPNLTRGIAASSPGKDEAPEAGEAVPCPNCGKTFDLTVPSAVLPIYPSADVQDALLDALLASRAAAKANKKRKAGAEDKGEKKEKKKTSPPAEPAAKVPRTATAAGAPRAINTKSLGSSVTAQLAEQEKKRLEAQAGMSAAVKSMFRSKDEQGKRGDAADFFGRTFNRYAA